MNWIYEQPVSIVFGNGKVEALGDIVKEIGGKRGILLIYDGKCGLAEKIKKASGDTITEVFTEISPNPDVTEVDKCAQLIRDGKCDYAVAVGGGSVMDCAKAAAVVCKTEDKISVYHGTGKALPDTGIPLIAIPTTSGTGSEVTCVSVLTDRAGGKKAPIVSSKFYPKYAIVDPELTYTVPKQVTANTGMDVLCHAIEGYWSRGHQPICDALAIHAAGLVFEYVLQVYENPSDKVAREKMAEASVIAGLAFTLPKTTSSHACSFPLTNLYGIPHGEACALTLDYFARINKDADGGRVQCLAKTLGFKDVDAMADRIFELKKIMSMRTDLKEFNLTDEQVDELVRISRHPNLLNNPIEITDNMLYEMYNSMR